MDMLQEMQNSFIHQISNKLDEVIKKQLTDSLKILGYEFFDDNNFINFIKLRVSKNQSGSRTIFYLDYSVKLFAIELTTDFSNDGNNLKFSSNYQITY